MRLNNGVGTCSRDLEFREFVGGDDRYAKVSPHTRLPGLACLYGPYISAIIPPTLAISTPYAYHEIAACDRRKRLLNLWLAAIDP